MSIFKIRTLNLPALNQMPGLITNKKEQINKDKIMKTTLRITVLLAILLAMFSFAHAVTVQVGDGTSNSSFLPIYGNYGYTYSQQIYTQSQINFAGEITKLRFFYVSGDIANSKDWTIYLGHSDKTEFTSTSDWEAPANLTQVFAGDITDLMPAPNNWLEITLTTPFTYNNTNNLIVAVYQNTPGYASMSWGAFSNSSNTGMYYRNDNTDPDPQNPPTASSRTGTINRIQFVFPDTEAPLAPVLLSPDNAAEVMNGQILSWGLPHGSPDAEGFDLYLDSNLVINNQPVTSHVLADMEAGEHSWYVVARNNIGTSAPSETRTFTIVNGVIIGDGTANQREPFNTVWGYGRSLGLYTNAQIGQLGMITTVGWNVQSAGSAAIPYKIYAKLTTDTELTQMLWDDFTATATLVKEGTYTFDTVGWHQFFLDTPILYTHGNLLLGVEANYGGSGAGSSNSPGFYYTTGTAGSHQYWRRDSNPPTTNGTLNTYLPNLLLMLSPLADDPVFVVGPTTCDFGSVLVNTTVSQAFTIANGGGGTLTVTGLSPMSDGPFTVTNPPSFPVELTMGQTASFSIEYLPTAAGEHTATFTVTAGTESQSITVSGSCFDPTIYELPWMEEFTDTTFPPAEWARYQGLYPTDELTPYSGRWTRGNFANISDPANPSARINIYGTSVKHWLVTPPIAIPATGYQLDFDVALTTYSGSNPVDPDQQQDDRFIVFIADNPTMVGATILREWNNTGSENVYNNIATLGEYQVIDLSAHVGTKYFAFYGESTVSGGDCYLFVDNVRVRETPAAPVFTYTPDTISFGTSFANTPTAYQDVTVSNSGVGTLELPAANVSIVGDNAAMFEFDPVNLPFSLTLGQTGIIPVRYNPTAEGAHSATLRIVYNGTNYDVALSGNALGEFALLESFEETTFPPIGWTVHNGGGSQAWQRSTSNPRTGAAHAHLRYDSVAHDDWLITPKIAPTATNHTFSFYGTNNTTSYDDRFNVLVSTTTPDITAFTAIDSNVGTGSNFYMLHTYDLSAYIGQQIYVAIQAISTNQLYLQIDDVSGPDIVAEMPAVPVLISPANNAIMVSTTPTFTWEASPGGVPTGFRIYCDTTNPPTTEVGTSGTASFTLTTPLENDTVYYWTVKAYNSQGASEAATPFSFTTVPAGLVYIGDGTSNQNLPIFPWYNYSYSQTIYLQSDINVANQRVENIAFYWNGANVGTDSRDWVVYMAHTDRTTFSNTSDWVPFDQLTQVFAGELDIPAEAGWINITLQNPFVYNNTDNLLICVDENTEGNSGSAAYFHSTTADGARALLYRSDGTNPDPANPPTATSTKSAYANIRMQFGDLPTTPVFTYTPTSLDFGTVMNNEQTGPLTVTVTNTGTGTINLAVADVSIIGPQAAQFSFDDANLPMALGTGVSATIPVFVTGLTEGPISATLRMVHGEENHDVALTADVMPAGLVFIGDGTSAQRQPFGTYWGFEHSAALYTAAEIGMPAGQITMLGWDCSGTSAIVIPYKLFLKNTTATEMTADTWTNFSTDLTQVKEGSHTFDSSGWHSFTLDTPFEYTGGNLFVVTESTFGGSGGGQGHTFKYTSTPSTHGYWYSDGTFNPDQTCPVNGNRPNLMLAFVSNTGTISGTVTGAGNQPLAGVDVTLADSNYQTTTNDAGEYQLLNVVEGTYSISFAKHGYQTHTQNVVIATDDELVINVTMQLLPQVTVSGTILASDTGAGLAGAAITLTGYEDYTANTTATGAFTIPNVFANNVYDYNITAAGYVSQNGEITVAATNYDMGTITLQEVAYAPVGVNAVANDADTEVTITWLAPDPNATDVTEGFESTTFPPSGWTQEITNNGPPNALGMYPTWCRIGSVTISGDLVAPTEGSYQSALYWSESHQDEWLITPGFNCPPSAYMTFNTLAFLGSEHDDHYYVKVSTDNGNNWTVLWDATAQTGGWTDYNTPITIDLSAYAGNQIKLAFHAEDPPINTGLWYIWFIDNIYIGNVISKVAFESDDFVRVSASDNLTRATTGAMTSMEISRDRAYGAKHNEPRLPRPEAVSRVNRTHRALTGYKVYRLTPGNEQNEASWTLLNQEPTADLSIVDPAWETLANGDYRWAVKAVYTNDVLSVPSLSNTLNKFVQRGNIIGTVKDKNNNYIRGAVVTAGEYSATTNSSGAYSLSVPVGTYDVTAEADEFKSETREGVVVTANSNTTVNFILQPVSNDDPQIPVVATMLNGNFPNPFNPETTISYSVKEAGRVKIEVYNIKGQLVKTLVNEDQITGHYKLVFDGKDASGRSISSGVYMLRMTAPGYQKATKMILMQ